MNPQYVLGGEPSTRPIYIFKEKCADENDAFIKYFRIICSNGYINKIQEEIDNMGDYCDLYSNVNETSKTLKLNVFYEPFSDSKKNPEIIYATNFVKLQENNEKGRHLVAAKTIHKNTVIINELPTVLQVTPLCECIGDPHTSLYRCHHCGIACKCFYVCDNCNVSIFCSRTCLNTAHKGYHIYECFGLQRHFWSMDDTDYGYISLRMVLYGATKYFDTNCTDSCYGSLENNYPFICALKSYFKDMSISKMNSALYSAVRNLLYLKKNPYFFKALKCKSDIDDIYMFVGGLLVKHYCQAQINNVLLRFPNINVGSGLNMASGSGKAICPTIALINHACTANCTLIICSNYIVVKSTVTIEKDEEITLSYKEVNAFFSLSDRRLITEEILHFTCKCSLCLFEENSMKAPYKCSFCENGNVKEVDPPTGKRTGVCIICSKTFPMDTLAKQLKRSAEYKSTYEKTYSLEPLVKLADVYKKIYPANSLPLLDIYRLIYEKHLVWGEKPMEILKYGMLIFRILDHRISPLYIPLLSGKIIFIAKMIDMKHFLEIRVLTSEEMNLLRAFAAEIEKVKKDLLFYLPDECLTYYRYIQYKVNNFMKAFKCFNVQHC